MAAATDALAQEELRFMCWPASSYFHFCSPWAFSLVDGAAHIQGGSSPSVAVPYANISGNNPEVCFTNLLGFSKSNQADNQN